MIQYPPPPIGPTLVPACETNWGPQPEGGWSTPAASVWALSGRPAGMRMDGGDCSMTAANAPVRSGCMCDAWVLQV